MKQNFLQKKSKTNYSPHMTLGCAPDDVAAEAKPEIERIISNREYFPDSVVVSHLANYCTVSSIFGTYPFTAMYYLAFLNTM